MKPLLRSSLAAAVSVAIAVAIALATGCTSVADPSSNDGSAIFAVTRSNQLIKFEAGAPQRVLQWRAITGLHQGEHIVGLDFRATDGRLYAIGTAGQLYTIDTANGRAEPVGPGRLRWAVLDDPGFAFDPVTDRIRMATADGDNLRLHPDTGTLVDGDPRTAGVQADHQLAFSRGEFSAGQPPRVNAVAYTNKPNRRTTQRPGARRTTLYAIDRTTGMLLTQGTHERIYRRVAPDAGLLYAVGPLGLGLGEGPASFDIGPRNDAFLSLVADDRSILYRIDLKTGAASAVGPIGADEAVSAIAIAIALPEPAEKATSAGR